MLKNIISITRAGNLIMVCLIFLLVRHTIILPFLSGDSGGSSLSDFQYLLLMLSTVLIAAGGYVINDIFDTGNDRINRPGTNKVGNGITILTAKILYAVLTISGIITAVVFGESTGVKYAVLVIGICAGLLYFYSSSYKSMFLLGNLIISLLAGLTVLITILFDKKAMSDEATLTVTASYSFFAFMITLNREIIKDCEDLEGDTSFNATTLPALLGAGIAKIAAAVIALIISGGIFYIQFLQQQWQSPIPFVYVLIFIQAPLIWLAVSTLRSNQKSDFSKNSKLSKLIMLTGILSMLVFHFSF